jgi:predicted nicotinamide N-methyase
MAAADNLHLQLLPVGPKKHVTVLSDVSGAYGGTCGSSLWAASTSLIEWLTREEQRQHRRLFEGRNVIELGAGLGFAGLALARLGARRVLLTDLPRQLPLLGRNLAANLPACSHVSTAALQWGSPLPASCREVSWDLVVATDVVYDENCVAALASTLQDLCCRDGRTVRALLALPDRSEFAASPSGQEEDHPAAEREADYRRLIALLPTMRVRRVGKLTSEEAGTCDSEMHFFVLTPAAGPQRTPRRRRTHASTARGAERGRRDGCSV